MKSYITYSWFIVVLSVLSFSCKTTNEEKTSLAFIKVNNTSAKLSPNGKYKYVFHVSNSDPFQSIFKGSITLSIISQQGRSIRHQEFEISNLPNGNSIDLDIEANTGLVDVHGEAGISEYGFQIKDESGKIKEGFQKIGN